MTEDLRRGYLSFRLRGEKLRGDYTLTRVREGNEETWPLIRRRDEDADAPYEPVESQPEPGPPCEAPDEADELS
jgi:hypothetical protein